MKTRMPARPHRLRRLIDFRELWRLVQVHELLAIAVAKLDDAIEIFVVDLVGGIGRTMVVAVRAGEKIETGHAGLIERGDVGWLVWILLKLQVETRRHVRLLEHLRPDRADVPTACAFSLLSCIRPTMSKFRYAAIWSSGTGGFAANAPDPMRPSSSPDQKSSRMFRRRGSFESASPTANTADVPEALSSAPKWICPASSLRASELPLRP